VPPAHFVTRSGHGKMAAMERHEERGSRIERAADGSWIVFVGGNLWVERDGRTAHFATEQEADAFMRARDAELAGEAKRVQGEP
jgi:hypothetical protein